MQSHKTIFSNHNHHWVLHASHIGFWNDFNFPHLEFWLLLTFSWNLCPKLSTSKWRYNQSFVDNRNCFFSIPFLKTNFQHSKSCWTSFEIPWRCYLNYSVLFTEVVIIKFDKHCSRWNTHPLVTPVTLQVLWVYILNSSLVKQNIKTLETATLVSLCTCRWRVLFCNFNMNFRPSVNRALKLQSFSFFLPKNSGPCQCTFAVELRQLHSYVVRKKRDTDGGET